MVEHKKEYYFLLILGVLTWWLVEFFAVEVTVTKESPPHSADFFSIGYTKMEMNESGRVDNVLVAERMIHFGDDKTITLDNPVMTFFNQGKSPWVVKSDKGLLSADRKDLFLKGKVYIVRKQTPGFRLIKVNTSNLRVKPDENYAETDSWAELIAPPTRVTGIGMKVFFRQPIHLKFISKVRSVYEAM